MFESILQDCLVYAKILFFFVVNEMRKLKRKPVLKKKKDLGTQKKKKKKKKDVGSYERAKVTKSDKSSELEV